MTQQTEPPPVNNVARPVGNSAWTVGSEGSREQLVGVAKLSFFRKTTRTRLELILVILVLVCLILLTALCISVYLLAANETVDDLCLSQQCLRSASTLLLSIDTSVNPCDNFYEYTCGKWKKEHVMGGTQTSNDWYAERGSLISRDVREYLVKNDSESEPTTVHQTRLLFRTCQDFESMNKVGLETLWKFFQELGLPTSPPVDSSEPKQPVMVSLARANKLLGMDFLLGIGIVPKPTNRTINKIAIAFAYSFMLPTRESDKRLDFRLHPLMEKGDEEVMRIWKAHASKILSYFVKARNISISEEKIETAAENLGNFLKNISDIEKNEKVVGPIFNDIPEEIQVSDLQELVDNHTSSGKSILNFREFFTEIFREIEGINLDLDGEDTILLYKKDYFILLAEFLEGFESHFIELAIWWKVAYALASHTNEELADLKQSLTSKAFSESYGSREALCVQTVYGFMTIAIAYQVTMDETLVKKREKIDEMLINIQSSFVSLVQKLRWMDSKTKNLTYEKVEAIRKMVGFPKWMASKEKVDDYYKNVTIEEGRHLANLLSLLRSEAKEQLKDLRIPSNSSHEDFDPMDVNAYYSPTDNSITIPAGILQFPFYDMGLEALNYGAIGVILGHELSHGFDNTGRRYDKDGNLLEWWSEEALEQYNKRIECYVEAYGDYFIESVNRTVNGNLTLGENLADNGGIREALMAYRSFVRSKGKETKLPGLQSFTHEQLFFLAFANIWCSEYSSAGLVSALEDEHSPSFVRVIVTLQNNPEFAEAWKCPATSSMNPSQKCKLWVN